MKIKWLYNSVTPYYLHESKYTSEILKPYSISPKWVINGLHLFLDEKVEPCYFSHCVYPNESLFSLRHSGWLGLASTKIVIFLPLLHDFWINKCFLYTKKVQGTPKTTASGWNPVFIHTVCYATVDDDAKNK